MMNSVFTDVCLIQITDTHLLADVDASFVGVNPEHHFEAILEQIQNHHPQMDVLIHTGDIAQDAVPETYQRYITQVQQLNVPFYHTLGNHDKAQHFPFKDHQPLDICIVDLEYWQIILLNSAVEGRVDGWIEQYQLDQLEDHLQHHNKPTILAFHHHPFPMKSRWIDHHRLKNSDALLAILATASQVKACFFGHVHQEFYYRWQHIDFYSTPATSVQFKPKSQNFALDVSAPAYRSIVLKATGTIETCVHRLPYFQYADFKIAGY